MGNDGLGFAFVGFRQKMLINTMNWVSILKTIHLDEIEMEYVFIFWGICVFGPKHDNAPKSFLKQFTSFWIHPILFVQNENMSPRIGDGATLGKTTTDIHKKYTAYTLSYMKLLLGGEKLTIETCVGSK